MKVKDFVEGYIKSDNKEDYLKSHIVVDYLNYLDKVCLCDRVINASCYKKINNKRVFHMNTPAQYMVFVMSIVYEYTDIDKGTAMVADFDYLDRHGLVDSIVANIADGEYETMQAILEMMIGDIMENERSIVSYLETKFDSLELIGDTIIEMMNDMTKSSEEESTDE